MTAVLHIERLGISPLKSGQYYPDHSGFDFDSSGRFGDRDWMFVEAEPHINTRYHQGEAMPPGTFLSQREDPVLARVVAKPVLFRSLELTTEGQETIIVPEADDEPENYREVSVWGWSGIAVDQGDEAADWGSEVVKRPVRLVHTSGRHPRFVEGNRDLGVVGFSDGYPLLVTSTGSIDAVNEQLAKAGKPPITHARFRPNNVLGGSDEPFIEDRIKSFEFVAGNLVWRAVRRKPCSRCRIIDKNPLTGDTEPGVQKALNVLGRRGTYADAERYGSSTELFFGQKLRLVVPKYVSLFDIPRLGKGDEVNVKFSGMPNWRKAA